MRGGADEIADGRRGMSTSGGAGPWSEAPSSDLEDECTMRTTAAQWIQNCQPRSKLSVKFKNNWPAGGGIRMSKSGGAVARGAVTSEQEGAGVTPMPIFGGGAVIRGHSAVNPSRCWFLAPAHPVVWPPAHPICPTLRGAAVVAQAVTIMAGPSYAAPRPTWTEMCPSAVGCVFVLWGAWAIFQIGDVLF
jgi:hypothetical protein